MKKVFQIVIYLYCIGTVVYFVGNYIHKKKQPVPIVTMKIPELPREKPMIKKSETKKAVLKKVKKESFKGKISIIIDDVGYNEKLVLKFVQLNIPLAFSCLPYASHTKEIAKKLHKMGYTVMLHMPCEPIDRPFHGLGPGALFVDADKEEIIERLEKAYQNVPFAEGLDIHEGSKFSQRIDKMDIMMQFLKKKSLFFVDSFTTPHSVGYLEAEYEEIPFAKRDVFLDNIKDISCIKEQLNKALYIARKKGQVVAIAHCNKVTYKALEESIDSLNKSDVQVVDIKRGLCTF
ncbi:MAG: divergent polysaccharide deacetylase family protein [Deltaproteobacteria bacterium]|nr:divergent polysaccharide deacetylase family protein [Deltaproteobacteria bacterium]